MDFENIYMPEKEFKFNTEIIWAIILLQSILITFYFILSCLSWYLPKIIDEI